MAERMTTKEFIPDDNNLHRRVNDRCYDALAGKCTEGAFLLRSKEEYLSVNWAERTDLQTTTTNPNSGKVFKLAELVVKEPRAIDLNVEHIPTINNFAHAGIKGVSLHDDVQKIIVASKLAEKSKMVKQQ